MQVSRTEGKKGLAIMRNEENMHKSSVAGLKGLEASIGVRKKVELLAAEKACYRIESPSPVNFARIWRMLLMTF